MNATRGVQAVAAIALLLALAGCGSGKPAVMPDVVGSSLDAAKSDIERAGFGDDIEVLGGGVFGIIDDSNWMVCEQLPAEGKPLTEPPRLTVDRSCDGGTDEEPAPESESPAPEPTADVVIVDTTVDELLNKINSADMGGIQVGDQFRFTGELFMSDLWMTGAAGEYTVLLKAQGGAQDLMVFVDEADAAGWQDGTIVEMVVESVEITIDGETSGGWLRARSVSTVS